MGDDLVLHLSNSLDVLLRQLSRAGLEESKMGLAYLVRLRWGGGVVVGLLDEVDEALGSDEALKEGLILTDVLHVVLKVEDLIRTTSLERGGFVVA